MKEIENVWLQMFERTRNETLAYVSCFHNSLSFFKMFTLVSITL